MVALLQSGLRGVQLLFVVITLALVGNVVDEAFAGNSSSINFALAVSIIELFVCLYALATVFIESLAFGKIMSIVDIFSSIFIFIAGTVLAAKLGVHSCGNQSYIYGNPLTNGSHNPSKRCHELQAATAFYWFAFPLFVASAALGFMGSGSSFSARSGIRRGGPSMSQV
ncbi:hypothetical protein QTJ16_005104 [Diplocarpon rosae]|uniref:MARVEL domain-containing protein n=1 Tax=Diplocarpon rosae TaxID=946125 RepID=A0AAD9SZC0_9HELO|nr:hypothetical protein QTJ16_005104 [Diplocarpon rosae]PBP21933.1 hypothetical protein BUE80_DR007218 [Diplocarpon rosae]